MCILNKFFEKFSVEKSCDTLIDFNCWYLTIMKFDIKLYWYNFGIDLRFMWYTKNSVI